MVFIKKASISGEVWYCLEVGCVCGGLQGLELKGVCPVIKWLLRGEGHLSHSVPRGLAC